MEIREAKKELKEYIDDKRYIERKEEEILVLTERINKVTASYSDMPRGGASSKEDLIAKKLDLEKDIYGYLIELVEKRAVVERTIQSLEARYRNILDFLYIEGRTLVDFAAKEDYSYRQVTRLLREAYKQYAEMRG